jgi:pyroglutamyl-peptidase
MTSVLITAFEPYDRWEENASWLALVELTRSLPLQPKIVTRRYPVDFERVRSRLNDDLAANYDYVLHLGQAPGISRVHLEAIGINVGGNSTQTPDEFVSLVADGPPAYRSRLPLAAWSQKIRAAGIPCQVSYHAGTYLCNAVLYLTLHAAATRGLKSQAAFIHLPLAPEQVLGERQDWPTLPASMSADAIRCVLEELGGELTASAAEVTS